MTGESETNEVKQPWECQHPHETFTYVLTARSSVGPTVTTKVTFHAQLTAKWCAHARRVEETAKQRRAAELRRTDENERASAETERHRIEQERKRFFAQCEEHGGSPVIPGTFSSQREAEENEILCRAPNGTVIERFQNP